MKLPDFLLSSKFNALREKIGASLAGVISVDLNWNPIELDFYERLTTTGVEVDIEDLVFLPDSTISINGKRSVYHIRDIADLNSLPRFHVAYCSTLREMQRNGKWQRFVAEQPQSGFFNIRKNGSKNLEKVELKVCQNCLEEIKWKGLKRTQPKQRKAEIVNEFTLLDFYEKYPKDLISYSPEFDVLEAPFNEYTQDWPTISERAKKDSGFACSECGIVLKGKNSKFLHTHHINSVKTDNSRSNLKVVCIGCHAEEFNHSHMKANPMYKQFVSEFKAKA